MPKSASASSVRPAPSSPMSPTISPAPSVSETSANSPARVACRDLERGRPAGERPRGQLVLDAFAGHQLGEPVVVEIGGAEGADLAAVAQHRDPLGDLDHLLQPVADEDDGDALRLQPADRREQQLDLVAGQRGGRLVHEEDAGVGGEAAADRDDLALRHGQRSRRGRRAEGRRRAARAPPAPSPASAAAAAAAAAPPSSRSMAIFSSTVRLGKSERSWKITWMPSARACCGVRAACATPSMTISAPGSGAWTPVRILISVDLPDPFSPTRQCTSPRPTDHSIASSATVPPNRLPRR